MIEGDDDLIYCPNCGSAMNPGQHCPECDHDDRGCCTCDHCIMLDELEDDE